MVEGQAAVAVEVRIGALFSKCFFLGRSKALDISALQQLLPEPSSSVAKPMLNDFP